MAQYAKFYDSSTDPNWPYYLGVVDPHWEEVQMGRHGFAEAIDSIAHTLDPGRYLIVDTRDPILLAMVFTALDDGTWKPDFETATTSVPRLTCWPPKVRR